MKRLALVVVAMSACESSVLESVILARVTYTRLDDGPACVRVAAVDAASIGSDVERFVRQDLDLGSRPRMGTLRVGIPQGTTLGDTIEVRASIHRGSCDAEPDMVDAKRVSFVRGSIEPVELSLLQTPLDGGAAGGSAGGGGGGSAGGVAGGMVAGGMAGGSSGGSAGGSAGGMAGGSSGGSAGGAAGGVAGGSAGGAAGGSAGGTAGGSSGGSGGGTAADAGCPENPPLRVVSLGSSTTWNDVTVQGDTFVVVGQGGAARRVFADGGTQALAGGCNSRNLMAVSVRPGDGALYATDTAGALLRLNPSNCTVVNGLSPSTFSTSVLALDTDTFVTSYAGTTQTPGTIRLVRLLPDGGSPNTFQSGFGQAWEVSGPAASHVFAAGWDHAVQQRSFLWRWDPASMTWATSYSTNTSVTPLFAIDVPSPNLGFAGGLNRFLEWNGSTWVERTPAPFGIFGLKVFSSTEVFAVGSDNMSRAAIGRWDGTSWRVLLTGSQAGGYLARIDGTSRCNLLAVGNDGRALTSAP